AWCGVPGVATAQVDWPELIETLEDPGNSDSARPVRPADQVIELDDRGRPAAQVRLWTDGDVSARLPKPSSTLVAAWRAWVRIVADRTRLSRRLDSVAHGLRESAVREDAKLRLSKLDALGEFAAGAGHELNNPLAVIVGRAQLLLAKETEPNAVRSL